MLCYAATATRTASKPVGLISKICTCSTLFLYISLPCFALIQFKVARYSFSGSIPPKFEHKLRRHKQGFGKVVTTVVIDKD